MADYAGYLYNERGLPLINVKVVAHNAATAAVLATVYTDSTGKWDFGALSDIPAIYAYTEFGVRLVLRGEIVGTIGGSVDMVTSGAFRISATAVLTGDGFYTDYNAGTPRLRVGTVTGGALVKGVYWDGANLAWIGVNTSLTAAGLFTAANAVITGTITASAGAIGSFTIGTYLYTGSKTAWNDTNAGVHLGSDGLGIGNNVFTVNGSTGALVATSATITGAITASSGSFSGVMNVGASGGIFQGTGTFAVPTTALKIYNSGGVGLLEMWGSGTKQVYFDTNGAFYAGTGAVKIDASGLSLSLGQNSFNRLTWLSGASTHSYIETWGNSLGIRREAFAAGVQAIITIQAFADSVDLHETSITITQKEPAFVVNSNINFMVDQNTSLELLTTHVHINDDTQVTGYLWASTYAAVGFTSAPANTTAGDLTATRLFLSGAAAVDTINETTPAAGVTIDGVLLKDGVLPVHASRHENAGADEISVAGLSGLLVDSQTPLSHGHSLHTDRTRYIWIPVGDLQLGIATGTPAKGVYGSWSTMFTAWSFDAASVEAIIANAIIPADWASGTITVKYYWTSDTATSGDCVWQFNYIYVSDGGDLKAAVVSHQATAVSPGTAHYAKITTITASMAAPSAAGQLIKMYFHRRGTDAADTMAGDALLIGVLLEYTGDS